MFEHASNIPPRTHVHLVGLPPPSRCWLSGVTYHQLRLRLDVALDGPPVVGDDLARPAIVPVRRHGDSIRDQCPPQRPSKAVLLPIRLAPHTAHRTQGRPHTHPTLSPAHVLHSRCVCPCERDSALVWQNQEANMAALAQTVAMHRTPACVGRAPVKGLRLGAAKRAPARTSLVCKVRPPAPFAPRRRTLRPPLLDGRPRRTPGVHTRFDRGPAPATCARCGLSAATMLHDRRWSSPERERRDSREGGVDLGAPLPAHSQPRVSARGSTWPPRRRLAEWELQWRKAAAWRDGIADGAAHGYRVVARRGGTRYSREITSVVVGWVGNRSAITRARPHAS